ncbi:MAG: ABC transporter ATP-binding protein [Bacilli bacterium]
MKKIFKILRKNLLWIFLVIIMLFLQAKCDLKLPDYTADIINVGIQQGGIDETIPKVITKKTMDNVLLFSDKDDFILKNYKLIKTNDKKYVNKYPVLKTEEIFLLKESSDKNLKSVFIKPFLTFTLLNNEDTAKIIKASFHMENSNKSVFEILRVIPKEKLSLVESKIKDKTEGLSDNIINQMIVSGIKEEYKNVELDVDKIQINYIVESGLKMLALAFLIMLITFVTAFLSSRIAASFSRDLRSKVVNQIMSYSNKEFDELSSASLITRSTNDIQQVQMLVVMLLRSVIYAPIIGLGALSKVSGNSMSWVILIAVLSILSLVIILFTLAMPKFKIMQKLVDKVNLIARETLSGLTVIRAFATEKHEEERFNKANKDLTKANLFVNRIMTVMMPSMMLIMNGVSVLIIWVGSKKVDLGTIQVGDLMAFITYTMQIIMSFLMISMVAIMLPRAWVSLKRIAEVLNKKSSVKDKDITKDFDKSLKGVIEFKDVYFRYPDAQEDVLENISFIAKPGTTTAFIGSTGSGKSTLVNLIPRFFDVTGGKVLIDGTNIKDVKLHDLRKKIGFVPQKGILFSGTIKSNISFGVDKISTKELQRASRISQSLEFISQKDKGYDSEISQGGINVSGGQKQRLAIARAVVKNPDIFVFDDSFSALDYKTDLLLRKALANETKNSTILIVAQRISTIKNADEIIVLDNGKIVGKGKHRELLKTCDVYKEIALSQLSKEELDYE